jgi:hypothetical protein
MVKKNDEVLDKKVRARLKEDVLNEINSTVKDELVENVVSDVKSTFNSNYKNEIKEEIKKDIVDDIQVSIKKDQAKLSRRKSFKIFRLNIYIILLIVCSCALVYRLYETGNIDINLCSNQTSETTTTSTTTTVVHDLDYLKNKYAYLLNNINITNYDLLKGSYNISNVSISDKLAMVYKSLNASDITKEGIITSIDGSIMESTYNTLFDDSLYTGNNFTVEGMNFAYSATNNTYIAIGDESTTNESLIYNISNITEDDTRVVILCYVALIKDNNAYNINDLDTVIKENVNNDISDILDYLSKVSFTFEYSNGTFHLSRIENK